MKRRAIQRVIGLELGRRRLAAAEVQREGQGVKVRRHCQASLSLDPFTHEPELAAREIRDRLEEAGIKGRDCVVGLPLELFMVHTMALPALGEDDLREFVQLEAERAFPHALEDLVLAVSRWTNAAGEGRATLAALPRQPLAAVEAVLRRARLRAVSIVPACTAAGGAEGAGAALLVGEDGIECGLTAGRAVAGRRTIRQATLRLALDDETGSAEELLRELRITLRRIPEAMREELEAVRLLGPRHLRDPLLALMNGSVAPDGLGFRPVGVDEHARAVAAQSDAIPPVATWLAADAIGGRPAALEFLQPRVARWKALLSQQKTRGMLTRAGLGLGALLALGVGAFVHQGMRVERLEREWRAVEPEVTRLETRQDQIRAWRPWFDDDVASLRIATALVAAFPPTGEVWARTLEIRGMERVTCMGYAKNNRDWLAMRETLEKTTGVEELQVVQARGENPVQFSLSYRWNGGATDGEE